MCSPLEMCVPRSHFSYCTLLQHPPMHSCDCCNALGRSVDAVRRGNHWKTSKKETGQTDTDRQTDTAAVTAYKAGCHNARQHRLLLSNVDLGRQQVRNGFCMMGTANCTSIAHAGHRSARGKIYQGFRCPKCRRFRSAKNAFIDGELREVPNSI